MPLTDAAIRNARPRERTFRLYDTGGLYLEVTPAGSKLWRLKYRFAGREKRLALGRYPEVGLAEARLLRDEARRLLAQGEDPAERRREEKLRRRELARDTFQAVAEEWLSRRSPGWSASYARGVVQRLRRCVFPYLGRRPVAEIEPPEVLEVVRRAERELRRLPREAVRRVVEVADRLTGNPSPPGARIAAGYAASFNPSVHRFRAWPSKVSPRVSCAG